MWPRSLADVPTVEGAYTPPKSVFIPPLRSTSTSLMQYAQATIPATTVTSFGAGFAAPGLDPRCDDLNLLNEQPE
jgi:hypothetical protein